MGVFGSIWYQRFTILFLISPFPSKKKSVFYFCINFSRQKHSGNILTANKDIHNDDTVFDPSQNDRLDINPGCFMKMPFMHPSNMMILSELTENKKNELWKVKCKALLVQWINKWISVCYRFLVYFLNRLNCQDYVFIWTLFCQKNKTNQ